MDGPKRTHSKTDFSHFKPERSPQQETNVKTRFGSRWASRLGGAVRSAFRRDTHSSKPYKKLSERRVTADTSYLESIQNGRIKAGKWKSTVSLGGLNDLKIRNLDFVLDWLKNRSTQSNNTTQLIARLSQEKAVLEAENRGECDGIDPQAAMPDKNSLSSVKKHTNVLAKKVAETIKFDIPEKKAWQKEIKDLKRFLTEKKVAFLNHNQWKPVTVQFENPELGTLTSRQIPAAHIRAPGAAPDSKGDLFPVSYNGDGVCSANSDSADHAVNLLTSSFERNGETLYKGVRHGTHGAYGIKDPKQRREAAVVRAKESVLAALSLKPELLSKALENPKQAVPLNIVSTSLLTPTPAWLAKATGNKVELHMMKDQVAAFQTLAKPEKQPVEFEVVDKDGHKKTIHVQLQALCFNFGVNQAALDQTLGTVNRGLGSSRSNQCRFSAGINREC